MNLENVTKELKFRRNIFCFGCPYSDGIYGSVQCKQYWTDNAITLEGAKILTLEEAEDALNTVVWVDKPNSTNSHCEYAIIISYSRKLKEFNIMYFNKDRYTTLSYFDYGKLYRFWDKRPMDNQRCRMKWDIDCCRTSARQYRKGVN